MDGVGLSLNNVTVQQGRHIISNIIFGLQAGDVMGLVGRSGSGKSTLIKGMLGKARIVSGRIMIYSKERLVAVNDVIGYSPQENSLYPFLTLEENIMTFGQLHGLGRDEIIKRMQPLLERLSLSSCSRKRIIEMSGGMQKRADLAVTLIHDPEIIILDEPFNGLDTSLQQFIWELLRELAAKGKIIIVSSHMLSDIQKNCNQFGLIEHGVFYNTSQIDHLIKSHKKLGLEEFLSEVFSRDNILCEIEKC